MARLPYVDDQDLPDELQAIFDRSRLPNGQAMNVYRMMAHSPKLLALRSAFASALLRRTRIDGRLRELAILAVGRVSGATYEYTHHIDMGQAAGVTPEQIAAMPVWEKHPAFSAEERAVIRYAEEMTRDVRVSDAAFAGIRDFLDNEQIVELTLVVAHYNSTVRFLEALQVELETDH